MRESLYSNAFVNFASFSFKSADINAEYVMFLFSAPPGGSATLLLNGHPLPKQRTLSSYSPDILQLLRGMPGARGRNSPAELTPPQAGDIFVLTVYALFSLWKLH